MTAITRSVTFGSHSSIKLDSGTFLFLPGLRNPEAREACAQPADDGAVRQLTIKAVGRFQPTVGTVVGRTLHITLAREHFAGLRRDLARTRVTNESVKLDFDVDDNGDGDVTNVRLNGRELCSSSTKSRR